MRVHGEKVIVRRSGMEGLRHYQDARTQLEEDFYDMCGYCGKNGKAMHEKFHIDHFVPRTVAKERENDYYNLVLACPKCNLSKSDKWPTGDPGKSNDGKKGFIDPATEDFDQNVERNEDGYVAGKTALGKRMCEMLHLDIRRTDLYWKISQIRDKQEQLEQIYKRGELTEQEKNFYIELNIILKRYIDDAFDKGE